MKYLIVNWQTIDDLTRKLFILIRKSSYRPDFIVGIARGGWVPARLLCDLFERVMPTNLTSMKIEFYTGIGKTARRPIVSQDVAVEIMDKRLLIIDDIADTGESLHVAKEFLNHRGPKDIRIGTLFYKPWSSVTPEYYIEKTEAWVVFPHELYEFLDHKMRDEGHKFNNIEEAKNDFRRKGISREVIDFYFSQFPYALAKQNE